MQLLTNFGIMPTCLCEWVFVPVCVRPACLCGCLCLCMCARDKPACVSGQHACECVRARGQPACVCGLPVCGQPTCVCVHAPSLPVCVCARVRPAYLDQCMALIRDLATSKYTSPQSQFGTYPCFWSYQWGQRALQQFQWKCFFGARPVSAKISPSYFPPKTT